jgi:diaminobutyrate-2-oxoglutarate transaminase
LIVETCGPRNEVLKLLPPLTIEVDTLRRGLDLLEAAFVDVVGPRRRSERAAVVETAA